MFTEKEVEDILSAVDQKLAGLTKSETADQKVEGTEGKELEKAEAGKEIKNTGTSTPEADRNGTVDSPKAGENVAKMGMGMAAAEDEDSDAPLMNDQMGGQMDDQMGGQMGAEEDYEATSPGEEDMGDQFSEEAAPGQEMGMEEDMMADGELSDEELDEIYGSMDDQELERHYMILRQHMQGRYQKAEIAMKNELKEQEGEEIQKNEASESSKEVASAKEEELVKKNEEMQGELNGLKEQLVALTQVFEKSINKPSRKSIVQENELDFVKKSEGGSEGGVEDGAKDYSQDELRTMSNDKAKENLTKKEREVINDYFIYGENKGELIKLLVGGKE